MFKLLMLKHDGAYLIVDSEESIMCMIKKHYPGIAYYTKYVSISVIRLTKLILRTPTSFENMRANVGKNLL